MSDEWVPDDCIVCGACYGHEEDCGARARAKLRKAQADIKRLEEFSNTLATILPEDAETWPGVNPDAAQEAIIEQALAHLLGIAAKVQALADKWEAAARSQITMYPLPVTTVMTNDHVDALNATLGWDG